VSFHDKLVVKELAEFIWKSHKERSRTLSKRNVRLWKPLPEDWCRPRMRDETRAVVNCRVCETAITLEINVAKSYKRQNGLH
jgi:hypothetical protein